MATFKANSIVQTWGKSLAVRIDPTVARAAGLVAGEKIFIEVVGEGVLIRPVARVKETLQEKLARFNPALHGGEVMPVQPVGQELC